MLNVSSAYYLVKIPRSRVVVSKETKDGEEDILAVYVSGRVEYNGKTETDKLFLKAVENLEGVKVSL